MEDCLKNPYVWLFAISYFFVYVVRQGVTSWFIFYLKVRACHVRGIHALCARGQCATFLTKLLVPSLSVWPVTA